MIATKGYAVQNAITPPAPFSYEHRERGPNDVLLDIQFCGICHSDIHQARNEWGNALYPMVPGHEIVGEVARVGSSITKFKVGDLAAVGCMVDSCRQCASCQAGEEQYCDRGATVWTYNSKDRSGNLTFGGYGNRIVVDEKFALRVPSNLNPAAVAPLLCAGIATYSPLRHWGAGPGKKIGLPGTPIPIPAFTLAGGRKSFAGSAIGGIRETQEMLDFCGKHNIVSDIEMTSFDKIEEAWGRVVKGDVKYRFVLDLTTLNA